MTEHMCSEDSSRWVRAEQQWFWHSEYFVVTDVEVYIHSACRFATRIQLSYSFMPLGRNFTWFHVYHDRCMLQSPSNLNFKQNITIFPKCGSSKNVNFYFTELHSFCPILLSYARILSLGAPKTGIVEFCVQSWGKKKRGNRKRLFHRYLAHIKLHSIHFQKLHHISYLAVESLENILYPY